MAKVDINALKNTSVVNEEPVEGNFDYDTRSRYKDKEPVKKKKKSYTPGPKKKRPDTKVKTYNLDVEVIEKVVEKSEEMGITASVFVNKVLRKELGI
ncbi:MULTISPECIES: hypothetical protein [Bacillus]|uniref:hypothetical protein n=1 Tax=Bacillus TaxID=1386 RepID=UPI001BB2FE4D|nr:MULTISPECIES: hypothetical protein [Bacillus]BCC09592.1 hypothetical protein BCM0060_p331 [Bacillus cereus]BCC50613.1 hypothetical protein BCJMU02_p310 [Bacillus cereus]